MEGEKINYNNARTTLIKDDEVLLLKLFPKSLNDLNIIQNHDREFVDSDIETNGKNITKIFENDKVKKYEGTVNTKFEIMQIYPANEKDIYKFSFHPRFSLIETWNEYNTNVRPIALKQNIDWIQNILNHEKESENILYEDDDFIFMYDYKCNRSDISHFYALTFLKNEKILSIRDLEFKHVELLSSIRIRIENFMKTKFDIEPNKLRMYFHYPPSFWYLHIHVNLFDSHQDGIQVDYSHMLSNVIQNLTIDTDYYKKVSMEIMNR